MESKQIVVQVEETCFKPHQRGGGCCSGTINMLTISGVLTFQTPSAGRWVLQLEQFVLVIAEKMGKFQTPSAGRWVLQLLCV